MSDCETATVHNTPAQSSLSDLRKFRLNKKIMESSSKDVAAATKHELSSPEVDNNQEHMAKKPKVVLTIKEKEERFLALAQAASEYEEMDVQDALARNNWEITLAQNYLKQYCQPKNVVRKQESTSIKTVTADVKRKRVKTIKYSDSEGSNDDEVKASVDKVYDSDDSGDERSNKMTVERQRVFDFLNNSTLFELQTVKSLSEKKANLILELRPFNSWSQLITKLEANKLSTELLNNAQELINKQRNIATILQKCNKLVNRLETAIQAGAGIVEQPTLLDNSMKLADYQLIGLNWLVVMHREKMNGILADEMGLGKTIQIIAFLAYLKEHNLDKGAHLIVVPSSTLDNWEAEIKKWCPSLIIERYHGSQDERRRMRIRYAKEGFTGFDVMLTTYHIVGSTPEERKMFRVRKLHYVVFDEAHMLKNMTTQRYTNLININAEMRILLTGTPLQNNLLELMSLLCFVMPTFFAKNTEDIKCLFGKVTKAELNEEDMSLFQKSQTERAKRIMKPFLLRRLKKHVLNNLPTKSTVVTKVPMSERQHQYYRELVEYYTARKSELCKDGQSGLSVMMNMRKTANHPLLMRHYFTDENVQAFSKRLARTAAYKKTNAEYIFEEMVVMSDFQIWQLCDKYGLSDVHIPDELICDSGKFQHLDILLPQLKNDGHRVLIFSQFTKMLDIVEEFLSIRKYEYCRLDGNTAVDERQDLINDFNTDSEIFIFLLSTKAGGVGINLTAADTCIIHDIDFNPYNDKQAEDRCHRMGQTRPVTIYRLVSENSIEEGILEVANEKLKLEQDITSNGKNEQQEQKCVVKLLTMALGLDETEKEQLNNSLNISAGEVLNDE